MSRRRWRPTCSAMSTKTSPGAGRRHRQGWRARRPRTRPLAAPRRSRPGLCRRRPGRRRPGRLSPVPAMAATGPASNYGDCFSYALAQYQRAAAAVHRSGVCAQPTSPRCREPVVQCGDAAQDSAHRRRGGRCDVYGGPGRGRPRSRGPAADPERVRLHAGQPGGLHHQGRRWFAFAGPPGVVCVLDNLNGEYGCSGLASAHPRAPIWSAAGRRACRCSPPPRPPSTTSWLSRWRPTPG